MQKIYKKEELKEGARFIGWQEAEDENGKPWAFAQYNLPRGTTVGVETLVKEGYIIPATPDQNTCALVCAFFDFYEGDDHQAVLKIIALAPVIYKFPHQKELRKAVIDYAHVVRKFRWIIRDIETFKKQLENEKNN